ncbi:MAG: hypothetical protein NTZ05_01500 [Chloroflexi bacterium]|nr:hypothetical protein [Chloroflexota bacterium]
MPQGVVSGLRWGLPIGATLLLLGGIRLQFPYALPLVPVALVLWLMILPKPLRRP